MKVLGLCGSLRAGSSNATLLKACGLLAPFEVVLYDGLGGLPHFNPDLDAEGMAPPAAVAELRGLVTGCAGMLVSTPEYAHGLPGSLKNGLDWLVSHADFAGKPVAVVNAAPAGGQHAQASLIETLRTMSARIVEEACALEPFLRRKYADAAALVADEPSAALLRARLRAFAAALRGDALR